ncbi:MAG: penicillin-binding protein 2, partial [Caulobacterales bacterium]|nr:penicillin-binding protein 2 [Caulobacterales bacterium]
ARDLAAPRRFVWVRRGLTPRQRRAVFDLGLAGLDFREEPRRVYPRGRFAAHVAGFADIDGRGRAGGERAFNADLTAGAGAPVALSLDIRAQHALEEELRAARTRYSAEAAAGVVMDVMTGEVLALASLPDFDPNAPAEASPAERRNRAMAGVFELGSVFKIFTYATALDAAADIDLARTLATDEPLMVSGAPIRDAYPAPGALTVRQAFIRSSNVGAALLALEAGEDRQRAYLDAFGLFDPAPVAYAESARPLVPDSWRPARRATLSYGYGLSVSPLAFTAAFAAAVNGGVYVEPTLRPVGPRRPTGRRVIKPETSAALRGLLRDVVADGTGRRADVPGYRVGGKTGTAEKARPGGYDPDRIIASFAAAFPIDAPRYAVVIILDEPKGPDGDARRAGGGYTAAPTAGRVIRRLAVAFGLPGEAPLTAAYRGGAR